MLQMMRPTILRLAVASAALLPACGGGAGTGGGATPGPAAVREQVLLPGPWRFQAGDAPQPAQATAFDDRGWSEVRVPHTWGAAPHAHAWYRTRFTLAELGRRRVFVHFEGVATVAEVYVNGHLLGRHDGAYTRFLFDATPHVQEGQNLLAVKVSNHPDDTVDSLPSSRKKILYWPYGGIYRKAWLLTTGPEHVDPTDHAASGVFVTPTNVSAEGADLSVRTLVRNGTGQERAYEVRHRLLDPDGREVAQLAAQVRVPAGQRGEAVASGHVDRPRLWGPGHPALYSVVTQLRDGDTVLDELVERTGFRTLRLTGKGFELNGRPVRLLGVGKHQETERSLNAMSDDEQRRDFDELQALGANFVRLAHYPHAPLAYQLADERGIMVWAENGHSNAWMGTGENGERITREMVRQNYNHPSIVVWSAGNEAAYQRVKRYARAIREEDPNRLVTYANNTKRESPRRYNLDFLAQNHYAGWYFGEAWDFERLAEMFSFISETGGGEVVSHHVEYAAPRHVVDVLEPQEYRQLLAEVQGQVVFHDSPHQIHMYLVWILRDFRIDKFKDWNTKGLVTSAGLRKDSWYMLRSYLKPDDPLVHITSKPWFYRQARATNGIKAYSNRPALRLVLNGADQGTRRNGQYTLRDGRPNVPASLRVRTVHNVFHWPVRLRPGRNEVRVTDDAGHEDTLVVYQAGPAAPDPRDPVRELRASNPAQHPVFVRDTVREQWPFYQEVDGTADNTFDTLPEAVKGAGWIATRRLSKPEAKTDLSFLAGASPVEVMVMATDGPGVAAHFTAAGFADTGARGEWRDDGLRLVPFRLFSRQAAAGERVAVPGLTADYVVMVK